NNDLRHAGFSLKFALQNETNTDITIPTDAKVMRRIEGGVLREQSSASIEQAFVPAHQRSELSLRIEWSCEQFDERGGKTERKANDRVSGVGSSPRTGAPSKNPRADSRASTTLAERAPPHVCSAFHGGSPSMGFTGIFRYRAP